MTDFPDSDMPVRVAALYHFTHFDDPPAVRDPLLETCEAHGLKGTILLSHEGINGTIAGNPADIDAVVAIIRDLPGCAKLEVKYSGAENMPFYRMKVRLKREIVTMGVDGIDAVDGSGEYVPPEEWNELISAQDTVIIDTRNDYEVGVGTFKGAIDPKTTTFRQFPEWFDAEAEKLRAAGKAPKIAMFCTGGIRCEKATAYVKSKGFDDVFHLQGGILKYLENVPEKESLFDGDCFVFDQRVAVGHGLELSDYVQCHACRKPLSPEELQAPEYMEGVSCPHCHDARDEEQKKRYEERQRQMELAAKRGATHIGSKQDAG